jgi:uncharacterized protein involved in type VI secretion and phage assembly
MSTANEAIQSGRPYYGAPEHGKVIDNADPDGLHRVKIRIPGIMDETQWAFPMGTQGGGSKGRGGWTVPDVGADVLVMFIGGDYERPVYTTGWWGIPAAGTEMPTEAAAVPKTDAHKIQTIHESSRLKVWVDERNGKEQLGIQDKSDEDTYMQIDMSQGSITISATSGVIIKCLGLVEIDAAQINIGGRLVLPDSKPIG